MEKQNKELSEGKINAGRGVAQEKPSNNNTTNKEDKDDRLDERARKAGY